MQQTVHFKLTETQHKKLSQARSSGSSVKLRLSSARIHPAGTPLLLTENEVEKLKDGNTHNITLSHSRVKKTGGILPILPILGGVGALTGIVTSIVNAVKNARKSNDVSNAARATEELAKFRLENEKKSMGSGLKFKCSR